MSNHPSPLKSLRGNNRNTKKRRMHFGTAKCKQYVSTKIKKDEYSSAVRSRSTFVFLSNYIVVTNLD